MASYGLTATNYVAVYALARALGATHERASEIPDLVNVRMYNKLQTREVAQEVVDYVRELCERPNG